MEGRDLPLEMLVRLYDLCAPFYTNCVALQESVKVQKANHGQIEDSLYSQRA